MSPQLKIIQKHLDDLDDLAVLNHSYGGLIESMEYAQFIYQRLGKAKKRTLADTKEICEMYQKWYKECTHILRTAESIGLRRSELAELHQKVGQFPAAEMITDINIAIGASENVLESARKELEDLK